MKRRAAWPANRAVLFPRVGDTDDPTGDASARVARGLAAVIGLGVHDYSTANDGVLFAQDGEVVDSDFVVGFAVAVGLDIAQVSSVPVFALGQPVRVAFG